MLNLLSLFWSVAIRVALRLVCVGEPVPGVEEVCATGSSSALTSNRGRAQDDAAFVSILDGGGDTSTYPEIAETAESTSIQLRCATALPNVEHVLGVIPTKSTGLIAEDSSKRVNDNSSSSSSSSSTSSIAASPELVPLQADHEDPPIIGSLDVPSLVALLDALSQTGGGDSDTDLSPLSSTDEELDSVRSKT